MILMALLFLSNLIAMNSYYNAPIELDQDKEAKSCRTFLMVEIVIGLGFLGFKMGGVINVFLFFSCVAMMVCRSFKIGKERDKIAAKQNKTQEKNSTIAAQWEAKHQEYYKKWKREINPYLAKAVEESNYLKSCLYKKWGSKYPSTSKQRQEDFEFLLGASPNAPSVHNLLCKEADCKWRIQKNDEEIMQEKDESQLENLYMKKRQLLDEMNEYREGVNRWKREVLEEKV
jgi:hypothetical protein